MSEHRVLIEDIAKGLDIEPESLTIAQKTYIYALISMWMVLAKYKEKIKGNEPTQAEAKQLTDDLIAAIKSDETLMKLPRNEPPIDNDFTEYYVTLAERLGIDSDDITSCMIELLDIDPNNYAFYRSHLAQGIQAHSATLVFDPNKIIEMPEPQVSEVLALEGKYDENILFKAPKNQRLLELTNDSLIQINKRYLDKFKTCKYAKQISGRKLKSNDLPKVQKLVEYFSDVLISLQKMKANSYQVDPVSLGIFCDIIKPYFSIDRVCLDELGYEKAKILFDALNLLSRSRSLKTKNNKTAEKLKALRVDLAIAYPQLVDIPLKKVDQATPIHRVILIGADDINDREVLSGIRVMIKKHPDENIIVTSRVSEVKDINTRNKQLQTPFKLHVFGHGSLRSANLGPIRRPTAAGSAVVLAKLVNQCEMIEHVRISACISGALSDEADFSLEDHSVKNKGDKKRKTYTVVHQDKTTDNLFHKQSVAKACWDMIDTSKGREIIMTVSPVVIVPSEEDEAIILKSKPEKLDIRDIHITTAQGIKAKKRRP